MEKLIKEIVEKSNNEQLLFLSLICAIYFMEDLKYNQEHLKDNQTKGDKK